MIAKRYVGLEGRLKVWAEDTNVIYFFMSATEDEDVDETSQRERKRETEQSEKKSRGRTETRGTLIFNGQLDELERKKQAETHREGKGDAEVYAVNSCNVTKRLEWKMPFASAAMRVLGDMMGQNPHGRGWRMMRGDETEMGTCQVGLPQKRILRQDLTPSGLFGRQPREATVREKGSKREREGRCKT